MSQIPKIQIRGSFAIILLAIIVSITSIYFANNYSTLNNQKIEAIEQDVLNKKAININVLQAEEGSLKKESEELNKQINELKKISVSKFDKDLFYTVISTFATVNDLKTENLDEMSYEFDADGFYTVRYRISLNGTMYGIMNFFNLLEDFGAQYSIDYFSFRQEGPYSWNLRNVSRSKHFIEDNIKGLTKIDPEELEEIIALHTKIENDDYDYGVHISKPSINDDDFDPLEKMLELLMQQELDPEIEREYEEEKRVQEEKTKAALEEKQKDIEKVKKFLEENYPPGTIIKNGQVIIPMSEGNMVLDVGITFTGNTDGMEIKPNVNKYLVSPEAITSIDANVIVFIDDEPKYMPSMINGVDVSDLNGLVISEGTMFIVNWNNEQLSKETLETFFEENPNRAESELKKVASEIRFLQQYNKESLELKKYLIFLYDYLNG